MTLVSKVEKMRRSIARTAVILLMTLAVVAICSSLARSQTATPQTVSSTTDESASDSLKKLDLLIEQNSQLEKQNKELMDQIASLRRVLAKQAGTEAETSAPDSEQGEEPNATANLTSEKQPDKWGAYTPNLGYKVANTDRGDLSISIYTYARYLNQLGLDQTFTNALGNVTTLQRRQDFQLNKLQIKFLGWILNQKFRYFLYAWSSNASQGLGAQVVLAGNLSYAFNKYFTVGAGIRSLPGTRSVEGNFPFWLGVDTRLIADEFFRPSYTSGVWASGKITDRLDYIAMIGNNLSTLGVSAAQLNNGFNTVSTSLVWQPSASKFGLGFGDFEDHQELASRLGAHFTRSDEDRQEQPNSDQFENTQIRLEDGTVVFTPNLFGPGISVNDLTYKMAAFDGGLKYHGFSLEGEYFLRWLDHFHGPGTAVIAPIFSHGFQLQTSAMVLPKTLQVYLGGSLLTGNAAVLDAYRAKYGNPWDFRAGLNYFPYHNKVLRWNNEFLYLYRSPVGYTSVPFALGGTGPIFASTLELAF
jgi:hypothetical protein